MDTNRTGQGMIAIGFIFGIIVLSTFFGGFEEKKRNPNQNPVSNAGDGQVEVHLKRNRQGHYVVTGEINNRPVEFLLDTGATDVVIPESMASQLSLQKGRAGRAMTANGPVTVFETMISQLRVGEIVLYNVPASINPGMNSGVLLGMSALSQVEFVQSGDSLTLRQLY